MASPATSSIPHYQAHGAAYIQALMSHDTGEARERFLSRLPPGAAVLDLGCGPGRDLAAFAAAGYRAVGLEGAAVLAAHARTTAPTAEVWEGDLLALDLPPGRFDGVWAHCVLFHVPGTDLPGLLDRLHGTLRPGGIAYLCDPTGSGEEGWADGRYLAFRRPQTLDRLMRSAGFTRLDAWRRPPDAPRRRQNWRATLWRRE